MTDHTTRSSFMPRDVVLRDCANPLASCFGDAKQELAAALLVLTLQYHLKPWGYAISLAQAEEAVLGECEKFWWIRSMGVPDFTGLLDAGFVASSGEMEKRRYWFTDDGIQALRLWSGS